MSNHTSTSGANQDADTISGFTRLQNASIQANRVNGKIALATFIDLIRINCSNGRHTNYLLPADADYLADLIFGKPDFYEIEFIAQKYPNLRNYLQTRSEVYQTMIFPAVRGIRAMLSGSKNPVHPDLLSKGFLAELNRQIQLPNTRVAAGEDEVDVGWVQAVEGAVAARADREDSGDVRVRNSVQVPRHLPGEVPWSHL